METEVQSSPPRSLPRRLLNRLEIDRAVFYAIATRAWQFLAGPISILVIANYFSPELQGYYYTFGSLMGMQSLVELGLHGVIINVSSHEWSLLKLDSDGRVVGDPTALRRLAGLKQFAARWYGGVAFMFLLICGIGGAVFLAQRPFQIPWLAPWVFLVTLNALLLWAWAFTAMLEGCNQVIEVHRVRLLQFVTGSFAVWSSMALGLGLWATVISVAVRLLWDVWLIWFRYRRFWESLSIDPGAEAISWKREIWPLQYKMAILGIASYLAFSLFVPVMFYCHGSVVAGQMGMTWTILIAIESAAYAWIHVRSSLFGTLAARQDWKELDRVFLRLLAISTGFYACSLVAVCFGVFLLGQLNYDITHRLSSRILDLKTTIVLSIAFLLLHLPRCQTIYVRAHKQDPFLTAGLISHGLIAALVIALGSIYGPVGAGAGLLIVVSVVNVPWWYLIWNQSRLEWHQPTSEGSKL